MADNANIDSDELELRAKPGRELKERIIKEALSAYKPAGANKRADVIDTIYTIQMSQRLPELDTPTAQAYAVSNERDPDELLYGLVCDTTLPTRTKHIKALRQLKSQHMVRFVTSAVIPLSSLREDRLVLVYSRPQGRKLSVILEQYRNRGMSDQFIIDKVVTPLTEVLAFLDEQQIAHGRICPDNIYFGDYITLGECLSEPCGYSQDYRYETIERAQAHPAGKGEGTCSIDFHALGILVARMRYGEGVFRNLNEQDLLRRRVLDGTYTCLLGNYDIHEQLQDFFRGTLGDLRYERWSGVQLKAWVNGRKFNLLPPSLSSSGSRSLELAGKHYYNMRSISQAIFEKWDETVQAIRDLSVSRWAESSAHRKDIADMISKSVKSLGGDVGRNEKQNNELVARCLVILDPNAPLRMRELSVHVDGFSAMLAYAFAHNLENEAKYIKEIMEQALPTVWSEMQKKQRDEYISPEAATALWNLERMRVTLRVAGVGFGMERCLYGLSVDQPCLSPMLKGSYANNKLLLLQALDKVAGLPNRPPLPMDRHIAGFIAARVPINREVKLVEFQHMPELAEHPVMVALKLLSQAQEKVGDHTFPGLSAWMASELAPLSKYFYSDTIRGHFCQGLEYLALSGDLSKMYDFVSNEEFTNIDHDGYGAAKQSYRQIGETIDYLQNRYVLVKTAHSFAASMARNIAYMGFVGVLVTLVLPHV